MKGRAWGASSNNDPESTWLIPWMRDSGVLILTQATALVMTSVLAVLVARALGPHEFGLFLGFLGLAQAFSLLADLGMTTWLLRELAAIFAAHGGVKHEAALHEAGARLGTAIWLTGSIGALLAIGAFATSLVAGTSLDTSIALLGLMGYTGLIALAVQFEAALRALRRLGLVLFATIAEKLIVLGGVTWGITHDAGIAGLALGFLAGGACRASFGAVVVRRWVGVRVHRPSRLRIVATTKGVLPFAFQNVALNMMQKLDVILVASVSATAGGYYAIGERITGAVVFIPSAAASALYPWLAREARPLHKAWRISMFLGLAGAVLGAVGILLAPTLVPALFGPQYSPAVPAVQVLLAILPIVFAANGLIAGLYSERQESRVLAVTVPTMAIGAVLIVLGAVVGGAEGAAAASVMRAALYAALLVDLTRRRMRAPCTAESARRDLGSLKPSGGAIE